MLPGRERINSSDRALSDTHSSHASRASSACWLREVSITVVFRAHLLVVQKKTRVGHRGIVDVLERGKIDEAVQVHQYLRMLVNAANLQRAELSG